MRKKNNFTSKFRNEFGEDWIFEYDHVNNIGTVSGSDVEWDVYPVIEGHGYNLIMDENEASWLKSAWQESVKGLKTGLYNGVEVEFKHDKKYGWLTNNYCPICLQQKSSFEIHHCIWVKDGGTNDYFNLLRICRSCHLIITNGDPMDKFPKNMAAFFHQITQFGILFLSEEKYKDSIYARKNKKLVSAWEEIKALAKKDQKKADLELKQFARIEYQFFRDMGMGNAQWREFFTKQTQRRQELLNNIRTLQE